MRGEVLKYDDATGQGLISGDDGVRYAFSRASLQQLRPVRAGSRVDFVPDGGQATEVYLVEPAGGLAGAATSATSDDDFAPEDLSIGGYFQKCLRLYATFDGRARRAEYWSFALCQLGVILAVVLAGGIIGAILGGTNGDDTANAIMGASVAIPLLLAGLYFLIPGLAVTIRRFHDVGMSGWLLLLALIPYLGSLFVLIVSLVPGQLKRNPYGPSPKRP
ncbi:MAG: DUF805 domain-containing protein [Alphaproteobacteria bacterium]|nr:DUF805 domain-containing protein [Alphaproteobacteria bacterium]